MRHFFFSIFFFSKNSSGTIVTTNPYGHTTFFLYFYIFYFSKNVSGRHRLIYKTTQIFPPDTRFELRKVAHSLTHVNFLFKLKFLFDKDIRPVHSWIRIQNLFYKNGLVHG